MVWRKKYPLRYCRYFSKIFFESFKNSTILVYQLESAPLPPPSYICVCMPISDDFAFVATRQLENSWQRNSAEIIHLCEGNRKEEFVPLLDALVIDRYLKIPIIFYASKFFDEQFDACKKKKFRLWIYLTGRFLATSSLSDSTISYLVWLSELQNSWKAFCILTLISIDCRNIWKDLQTVSQYVLRLNLRLRFAICETRKFFRQIRPIAEWIWFANFAFLQV